MPSAEIKTESANFARAGLTLLPRLKARQFRQEDLPNVDSFYHLRNGVDGKCCNGTACFVARHLNPARWEIASAQTSRVYCLGKCFAGPAHAGDDARPRIQTDCEPIILERLVHGSCRRIEDYIQQGGYRAFEMARRKSPEEILREVEASGLRGRGGAAFPTGKKWRAVFDQPPGERYVVANADEGDPGAYIDRFILEDDPHCLIEAMLIASRAVSANRGVIYLRTEYPAAKRILEHAIAEARQAGFLDSEKNGFDIELVIGSGSYLCGEETALLNSIEGKRPVAMARPPFAAERGLFGKPTLINNVETFASIPWIIRNGGEAYFARGFSQSRGTKVVSLNSLFRRPGLYEVEFGVTIRHIIENLGGGLQRGELRGVMIGGPLAGIIPPHLLDTPFAFEELRAIKAAIGHGGIVAFDEHTSIAELVRYIFSFGAYESCGKCTPCRLGAREIERVFQKVQNGDRAVKRDALSFREIVAALKLTSLCGHGFGLAEFAESVAHHFPEELAACFE